MCIRDRTNAASAADRGAAFAASPSGTNNNAQAGAISAAITCLLYTSDAADERSSVDLGGRRIIKKKTTVHTRRRVYE